MTIGQRMGRGAALLGCLVFLGGCGSGGENTALGMEALKALDYEKAIELVQEGKVRLMPLLSKRRPARRWPGRKASPIWA